MTNPGPITAATRAHARLAASVAIVATLATPSPARAADISCDTAAASPPTVVEIPVDLRDVKKAQAAFDAGDQPWRADPRFVAYIELGTPLERDVEFEDMKVERETPSEAIVVGRGAKCWYRVSLRRFSGGRNVWVPVEIEYARGGR